MTQKYAGCFDKKKLVHKYYKFLCCYYSNTRFRRNRSSLKTPVYKKLIKVAKVCLRLRTMLKKIEISILPFLCILLFSSIARTLQSQQTTVQACALNISDHRKLTLPHGAGHIAMSLLIGQRNVFYSNLLT